MKKLITEAFISDLAKGGKYELNISDGAIITPLAHDKIKALGIRLISNKPASPEFGKIFSFDNIILAYKNISPQLLDSARQLFFDANKIATFRIRDKFPDTLTELVKLLSLNESDLIIIVTNEAEETAIFANKFPKVRAMVCYDEFVAKKVKEKLVVNCIIFDSTILTDLKIISLLRIWQTVKTDQITASKFNHSIFQIEKFFINRG